MISIVEDMVLGACEFRLKFDPSILELRDGYPQYPRDSSGIFTGTGCTPRYSCPPRSEKGAVFCRVYYRNGADTSKERGALAFMSFKPKNLGSTRLDLYNIKITTTIGTEVDSLVGDGEVRVEGVFKDAWEDIKDIARQLRIGDILAIVFVLVEVLELLRFYKIDNIHSHLGIDDKTFKQRYPYLKKEKPVLNGLDVFILWIDTVLRGTVERKGK